MHNRKILIKNYGCSANTADGETLAGCLKQANYQLTNEESEADLIIYNSCAVKGPTENRIIDDIKRTPKGKKIVISGCLPRISLDRLKREVHFNGIVGPAVGKQIVNLVNRVFAEETVIELPDRTKIPALTLPRVTKNPVVSIVPINFGCLGSCAYCCVVHARGKLQSHSIPEITQRIQADYEVGAREFWLTSQDTASYGRDIKTNLAQLLCAVNELTGKFRTRVGMMTPNLVADTQEELIGAFESEKIFKFLHLPVQSGDDKVLDGMRRFYTAEEFKSVVESFRETFPDITLATDIIVGFPGETEEAFNNTLKLMKEIKPDITNVSKFFPRPKTDAWKMHDGLVVKEEIKRRSAVTADLAKALSAKRNSSWVGWYGEVFVDEKGKKADSWISRNFAYKPIVISSNQDLLGKTFQVKVVESSPTYLKGIIIEAESNEVGYFVL